MKMDFTFEIDEFEIEVTKGVFTTISASLRVEATQDSNGDIFINTIEADCGAYDQASKRYAHNWVRVDDEPMFNLFNKAVEKAAEYHAPTQNLTNPNDEHRLSRAQMGV